MTAVTVEGITTIYAYNVQPQRVLKSVGGTTTRFFYGQSYAYQYEYDGFHHRTRVTKPLGEVAQARYEDTWYLPQVTDYGGERTFYTRNGFVRWRVHVLHTMGLARLLASTAQTPASPTATSTKRAT